MTPLRANDEELIERTLEVFQPRTERELTHEDAREISHNLTGFFRLLMRWDEDARRAQGVDAEEAP